MSDRAVSDALGYVFVFALVTSSVAVVYIGGFQGLQAARDQERVENAARAFDVLADNLDDISRDGAPSRATEIKVADADLGLGEESQVKVTVTNLAGTPNQESNTVAIAPITYQADGQALTYESGVVFREGRRGAVVTDEAGLNFFKRTDERIAIVPVVQTRSSGDSGTRVSGEGTVLIRAEHAVTEVMSSRDDAASETVSGGRYAITITIQTAPIRAEAWERYLERRIPASWDGDGDGEVCLLSGDDTVTCDIDVDHLYVTATRIDISIA